MGYSLALPTNEFPMRRHLFFICRHFSRVTLRNPGLTVHGKGGKTRFLKLTDKTAALLEEIRPEDAGPDDPVFLSQKGNPLSTRRIWDVRVAGKRAGIKKDVSPHFMRHSHASHALDRGAPIHLVQAQLGHASLATTSKYTHARPDDTSSRFLAI